jgi:ribosome-associated protein
LEEKASFCSYFVIVSGTSSVHLDTIADAIDEQLSREQYKINHVEGIAESGWIVLDIGDIVVHIFHPEKRRFYNLERLWADARFLDVGQIVKT